MMSKFFIAIFLLSIGSLSAQIKIGIALPLMKNSVTDDENKSGEMILKGITDAAGEFDSLHPAVKVITIIEDTEMRGALQK